MMKFGMIVALIMLGIVFQDPAKSKPVIKPPAQEKKLPPFPMDKAKWMIHGKVKADALLTQSVPGPKVRTLGKKGLNVEFQHLPRQNPRNLMLPGAVVTVLDLERRWRFKTQPQAHRITITDQRRFVPRNVILRIGDSVTCENLSGAQLDLSLQIRGGFSSTYRIHPKKKMLINHGAGRSLEAHMIREGIHVLRNLGNASRGKFVLLGSGACRDSQSWVYLSAHPISAVTDEYGRFSLPKLPDGEYTVVVNHGLLGRITKTVKIEGRPRKWVEFEFKVPEELRAKPTTQPKKGK